MSIVSIDSQNTGPWLPVEVCLSLLLVPCFAYFNKIHLEQNKNLERDTFFIVIHIILTYTRMMICNVQQNPCPDELQLLQSLLPTSK